MCDTMATNMQTILAIRAEMYKIEHELAEGNVPHSDQAGLIQFWEDLDEEVFRLEMMMENTATEPIPAAKEDSDGWDYQPGGEMEALTADEAEYLLQEKEEAHAMAWAADDWYSY